jgi:hypothetical protein
MFRDKRGLANAFSTKKALFLPKLEFCGIFLPVWKFYLAVSLSNGLHS